MNFESRIANHYQILRGGPLHIHGMPKEHPDDPRMYVLAGRFGKQQHAIRLQNTVKFAQRVMLMDQVMECLVAEHHIDGLAG
jgi:hypothetical protein